MTSWEPPRRTSRRTVVTAVGVAGLTLVVGLVAAVTRPGLGPPSNELPVERRPSAAPSIETAVWQPLDPGVWRTLPDAPLTPRVAHDMVSADGRVLVLGGFDVAGRPLADGGLFDPDDGTWRRVQPAGARGTAAYATRFGDDIVVVSAASTQRYDPSADRWHVEASLPPLRGYTLTDQVVSVGDGVVVARRPIATGTERPAVFALRAGDTAWRRLPDPPARFTNGDVLLGDATQVLLFTRARPGRAAIGLRIDLTSNDSRWRPIDVPPGLDDRVLVRLLGALDGTRVVLVGIGAPGDDGYAAAYDGRRWRRLDPPPPPTSPLADALWVGDELIVWNRSEATGAVLDVRAARWTRLPPAPIADVAPRPAAWTGTSVVTWGGFAAAGAAYRLR